jgi:hypothetical protein
MASQGRTGSSRATGAASRGNAQNAQATRQTASDSPATAQRGLSEEEEEEGALLEILSLFTDYVIPGKRDEFATTLLGVLDRLDLQPTHSDASSETLRDEIHELRGSIDALSKALPRAQPGNKTWAEVAATGGHTGGYRGRGGTINETPRIVVPERRTREVIIKAPGQSEDLARRSSVEVVEATNRAMGGSDVVAARRLPSGDTILTFEGKATEHTENTAWVQAAFGASAQVKAREFTVIAKGLPTQRLRAIHDPQQVIKEFQKRTAGITRCKVQLPKQGGRHTVVILHMNSVVAAQEVCRRGVVFEAQYFDVEPFYAATQIRRCYKCHKFGHIARYCQNQARCGCCAGVAHEGGEANCPEKGEEGHKKCVNCKRDHPAWDQRCPVAAKEVKRAREAYTYRPLQFDVTQGTRFEEPVPAPVPIPAPALPRQISGSSQPPSSRPTRRGRPTDLSKAARTTRSMATFLAEGGLE